MKMQEKYYKKIGSTRLPLIWARIIYKRNTKMNQSTWKYCNSFVHHLLPNGLVGNEYNMLKNRIMMELNLGTKDTRKGIIHLMKDTEESINTLLVTEKKACLCSVYLARKDKRPKYKVKLTQKWKNYGR